MLVKLITFALCSATLAAAHFSIEYPEMRGDSFAEGASQYLWPCEFSFLKTNSHLKY